jgi:outer membrane protein OmpA-like peptidoglycan-associated protein
VRLSFKEGTLSVSGYVPPDWEAKVRIAATLIGGVERLRFLAPGQMPGELREMAAAVEALLIFFESDAATLLAGQEDTLRQVAGLAKRFAALSESFGARPLVEVIGHIAGPVGNQDPSDISGGRAARVRDLLRQHGVAEDLLQARGAGSREPVRPEVTGEDRRFNRSATFRLLVDGIPVTP